MAKRRDQRRKSSLAFPYEPESERGDFIQFLDDSGAIQLLIGAFTTLYNEPVKPENPILWLKDYFKSKEKCPEAIASCEMNQLKKDILAMADEYEAIKLQLSEVSQIQQDESPGEIERNNKRVNPKVAIDARYIEEGGDSRWLIKPDPGFTINWPRDELAVQIDERKNKQKDGHEVRMKSNDRRTSASDNIDFDPAEIQMDRQEQPSAAEAATPQHINIQNGTLGFTLTVDQSTETSPQPSMLVIEYEEYEAEADEEMEKAPIELPKPKMTAQNKLLKSELTTKSKSKDNPAISPPVEANDKLNSKLPSPATTKLPPHTSPVLERELMSNSSNCISPDFWTRDFSLGKVEPSDEDEDRFDFPIEEESLLDASCQHKILQQKQTLHEILGKPMAAEPQEEFGWLPSILQPLGNLSDEQETKSSYSNFSFVSYQLKRKPHGIHPFRRT